MVQEIARFKQNVGVALSLASVAHIIRDCIIAVTGPARP